MASHNPGEPLLTLPKPPPPPDAVYSCHLPMHWYPAMVGGGLAPSKVQTCHRPGSGVGVVPLFQNHYRVPHVVVQEVYPEVGSSRRLPLAAPHCTPNGPGRSREGDPIYHGFRCDGHCWPLRGALLPVMGLAMVCQRPRRQLQLTLWKFNSLPLQYRKDRSTPIICRIYTASEGPPIM